MHPDLSTHLHTGECNDIIYALKVCHKENPWKKFLGVCNDLDHALNKCLKNETVGNFPASHMTIINSFTEHLDDHEYLTQWWRWGGDIDSEKAGERIMQQR